MDMHIFWLNTFLLATVICVCHAEFDSNVTPKVTGNTDSSETPHDVVDNKHDSQDNHSDDHESHTGHHSNQTDHHGNHKEHHGIHVASWNYEYVEAPLIIVIFVIITGICRLGFHHLEFISSKVPESCLLIILGSLVGLIMRYTPAAEDMQLSLDPRTFFLFLLPQIILESAYSLHDRVFFDNLGTVLWYAVIGTLFNWIIIGPVLYGLSVAGAFGELSLGILPCMVFSALIVAVDPVAVLAIFQEVGVNNVLYFLVFGESLLNDAVTVVLYNTMNTLNLVDDVTADQIFLAIAAFFTVSLGGLSIGILYGLATSFLTKYTVKVKVVEPLAMFSLAYASYLSAELFHFSGIISIIGCGLVQAQYAFHNIGHKSLTTVTYFSKMLSSASDSVIFMFLGLSLVSSKHQWNTGFVLCSVVLCFLVRFFGVFLLSFIANKARLRKVDYEEQFIMAYGGLRGAVAFSLVAMLKIPEQNLFETAALVIIICTVFIQGISIKPLVKLLRIQTAGKENTNISTEISCHVVDHVVAGIEEILGCLGRNALREFIGHYDEHYLKPWFQRCPQTKDDSIMELYQNVTMDQHYDAIQRGESYTEKPYSGNKEKGVGSGGFDLLRPLDIIGDRGNNEALRRRSVGWTNLANHPDLSHRILDEQLRAKVKRWEREAEGDKKSKPNTETKTPTEMEEASSQPGSPPASPAKARWRALSNALSKGSSVAGSEDVKANPTVSDIRAWVVKPVRESLGQKYDKNLISDKENDLVHLLDQKALRLNRMLSSDLYRSMSSFRTDSPCGSPENLPGTPRRSTHFEPIAEEKDEAIEMEEKSQPPEKSQKEMDTDPDHNFDPVHVPEDKAKLLKDHQGSSAGGRGKLKRQADIERESPGSD